MKKMIPRLDVSFPLRRQYQFWFGDEYKAKPNEFLLNSARAGIVMALRTVLPNGGSVGVVAYNCDTVYNAVYQAGCRCVFLDVDETFQMHISDEDRRKDMDAVVVTNLFGIKNDIAKIRDAWPNAFIIEDDAHGYGLSIEGDVAVYSINQGKYPALGPGGILKVSNTKYLDDISLQYKSLLGKTSFWSQCKVFAAMFAKALIHHPLVYGSFTRYIKKIKQTKSGKPELIEIRKMPIGVNRLYNAFVREQKNSKAVQKQFMDVIFTQEQKKTIAEYEQLGVETGVHFRNWPIWAANYGYLKGDCPIAERLVNQVVMVPNYNKLK